SHIHLHLPAHPHQSRHHPLLRLYLRRPRRWQHRQQHPIRHARRPRRLPRLNPLVAHFNWWDQHLAREIHTSMAPLDQPHLRRNYCAVWGIGIIEPEVVTPISRTRIALHTTPWPKAAKKCYDEIREALPESEGHHER